MAGKKLLRVHERGRFLPIFSFAPRFYSVFGLEKTKKQPKIAPLESVI